MDSFLEECRLIKELKPRYNRQLKNSHYYYIKLPAEHFPKLTIVTTIAGDGGVYFGPFTSRHRVESTVQLLQDSFLIRKCTSPGLVTKASGCLFRQLGKCLAVCTGQVSREEYWLQLEKIRRVLTGQDLAIVEDLNKRVNAAAAELKFKQAARYAKYYTGLRHVIRKQRLVATSNRTRNILAVEFLNTQRVNLFYIKGNRLKQ